MTIAHFTGPIMVLGADGADTNPSPGPSLFRHGVGLLDPRANNAMGGGEGAAHYGWYGTTRIPVINAIPVAMAANNIAALQAPAAGVPINLSPGAGTLLAQVVNAATGTLANVIAIESAFPAITLGADPTLSMYDPSKAIARNVRITSAGADTGGTFTVRGFDLYGFPMTETITGAAIGVAVGKKAFKFVQSITPSAGLSGANIQVGTGDTFGFPLRVDNWGDAEIYAAASMITVTTGFLAAVTTNPSTPLLGDVRGTYAVQTPSDGIRRLQVFITPDPNRLTNAGMFGVQQV